MHHSPNEFVMKEDFKRTINPYFLCVRTGHASVRETIWRSVNNMDVLGSCKQNFNNELETDDNAETVDSWCSIVSNDNGRG